MAAGSQRDSESVPTVLITGAGGFLGRSLVERAVARGWRVHATLRNAGAHAEMPAEVVVHRIDLGAQPEQWRRAMNGVDVVIHAAARAHILKETAADPVQAFAALNTVATRTIATAAVESGVRRFVFVSSIGVNGNVSGAAAFTEQDTQNPSSAYAISKRDAERALQEVAASGKMETVIVRPPLVYGPHVKANFLRLLRLVDRGVPLPFKSVRNRRSFVFVANLVDLILTCVVHPAAAGEVFLASDGSVFSTPQLLAELAGRMGRTSRLFRVPPALLRLAAAATGRRLIYEQLCCSLEVDGAKAAQRLGWNPVVAPREALDSTIQWYLAHGRG